MLALLDLDETLVDRRAGFDLWAREFVLTHGLTDRDRQWLLDYDLVARPRDEFFTAVRERFHVGDSKEELWADYRRQMPHLVQVFDGVLPELRLLRLQSWRLFIVTNGKADNQVAKLRSTGLSDVVDGWCISEETGHRKPSPAFFTKAIAMAGRVDSEPVWVVGDSPVDDIQAGNDAGLETIWISHGRSWPDSLPPPTAVADSPVTALRFLCTQP